MKNHTILRRTFTFHLLAVCFFYKELSLINCLFILRFSYYKKGRENACSFSPVYRFLDNEFILYPPVNCFIIMNLDLDIFDVFYSSIVILLIDSQSVPCLAGTSPFSLDPETLFTWRCSLIVNLLSAFSYSWNYLDLSNLKLPCTFINLRIIKTLGKNLLSMKCQCSTVVDPHHIYSESYPCTWRGNPVIQNFKRPSLTWINSLIWPSVTQCGLQNIVGIKNRVLL